MIPRLLILIGLVLAGFSALFYLVTRVHRFRFSLALARGRRGWSFPPCARRLYTRLIWKKTRCIAPPSFMTTGRPRCFWIFTIL